MLPHAAHARQVVLELRELDLELSLGASTACWAKMSRISCVRSITRASSAFSRKRCCAGIELVVDEQALGLELLEALLQLLELALADVGALRRAGAVLHDAADGLDAGRARELLDLGELLVRRRLPGPAPRGRTRARAPGNVESSARLCPLSARTRPSPRPTLALVDIPSASREEASVYALRRRAHVAARAGLRRRRVARSTPSAAASRSCCSPGTPTPCRRRATCPGRIEDGCVVGLGASDMKGGLAVMIELARWAGEAELAYDLGLLFFPREELGPGREPAARRLRGGAARRRGGARDLPRADRQHAPARLPRQPQRARRLRGPLGALGAAVARRERDRASRSTGCGRSSSSSRATSRSTGSSSARCCRSRRSHGGIATNVIPARVEATLNFRYAPDRTPAEAEARVRELVGRDVEILSNSPPAHVALGSPLVERAARAPASFEVAAEAGVDERRRLRRARARRASTSARARRATRTRPTSGSRSPSSSGRYDALQRFLAGTV